MLEHGGHYEEGVIDFSVNTNPCVTKEKMTSLLLEYVDSARVYPDITGECLLNRISEKTGVDSSRLVLGNGATDCLYRCMQVLKPVSAAIIVPTFSEYERALDMAGCETVRLIYDMTLPSEQVEQSLLKQIKKVKPELVVMCNPNNPSGHLYSDEFIDGLIEIQKIIKGYLMVDESFGAFEGIKSCYRKSAWNLIVLTSLTKYFGIPGLRIGYMSGGHSVITKMKASQMPWQLNGLALKVTENLLEDDELDKQTQQWYRQEKAYMIGALGMLKDVHMISGHTNYILCHLDRAKGSELNRWLLQQNPPMAIRECASFDGLGDDYIRIAVKEHENNEILMEHLYRYWREERE